MFIVTLIFAAGLTSISKTDYYSKAANVAIQRKGNRTDETCECGKSITLSCIFKTNTIAIEWIYANNFIPIAKCYQQNCTLNPEYVDQFNISFDMTQGFLNLTLHNITMELNGKILVCSDGSDSASYNISVRDYEPNLIEDLKSGTIAAISGCISHDTQVSFKWMMISARSNVEMEIKPNVILKNYISCTNDSNCGNDMHVYYSEIIDAKASAEGNYYLKVTAIYGNKTKVSFSSNISGQMYIIEEQDEEHFNSDRYYSVKTVVVVVVVVVATLTILVVIVLLNYRSFRCRQRLPERSDTEENKKSSQFQSRICKHSEVRYDELRKMVSLNPDESQSEPDPNIITTTQNKDTEKNGEQPGKGFIKSVYGIVSNLYFQK